MGKILAINGSPRAGGNTYQMLFAVLSECERAGHETELFHAGGRTVSGCLGCGYCRRNPGKCSRADWVDGELYQKMAAADAIVIGSPTYFSDLTAETKAILDRTGPMAGGDGRRFSRKIGAAVSAVRRAGGIHTLDSINHFFQINDMVMPGSSYWNMSLALFEGDFERDEEGGRTMTRLGENIAWLVERLR
ncbi:MAG: flavodoxin family protein [Oscillospiraceae bacterium]|nr:flavodoxin family protein [Oscillospiraceae bacterium]